jgi:hypothetical protein
MPPHFINLMKWGGIPASPGLRPFLLGGKDMRKTFW